MLVTSHARARNNISSHRLIKAVNNHIKSHTEVITLSNKEVILRIQTLIKLPATFIMLSHSNGWTPCTAAVRGMSFLKVPAATRKTDSTCNLFQERTQQPQQPQNPFRSTLLWIAGLWRINMRGWISEEGLWLTEYSTRAKSTCWPYLHIVPDLRKAGCSRKRHLPMIPRSLQSPRPQFSWDCSLEIVAPNNSTFCLAIKKSLSASKKTLYRHFLDSKAANCLICSSSRYKYSWARLLLLQWG